MRATPLRYFCEPLSRYMKIAGSRVSLPFPLHWLRGIVDTAFILLCRGAFADCEP